MDDVPGPFYFVPFLLLLAFAAGPPALAQPSPCGPESEEIPIPSDTLLYVDNRGLSRIFVQINDSTFKLAADSAEVARSRNAFPIPRTGEITVDVATLVHPEGPNCIAFTTQGPPGSSAEIILAPVLLAGQEVAYAIKGLEALPETFALLQSYPNPFRGKTTITYEIPQRHTTGLPVRLAIYDLLGRRVRTLVDDERFPGRFTAIWDGTGAGGGRLSSGMYFCQLVAGPYRENIRLVLLR